MPEHQSYLKSQIQYRHIMMWIIIVMRVIGVVIVEVITLQQIDQLVNSQRSLLRAMGIEALGVMVILAAFAMMFLLWIILGNIGIYIRTMNELMLCQMYLSIDDNTRRTAEALERLSRRGQ